MPIFVLNQLRSYIKPTNPKSRERFVYKTAAKINFTELKLLYQL